LKVEKNLMKRKTIFLFFADWMPQRANRIDRHQERSHSHIQHLSIPSKLANYYS
jgi:hypothetical protein